MTETVKLAGVVALAGDTLSQEFTEVAATFTLVALDAPMDNVWAAGGVAPSV